jgi:precorrin-6x reductase
MQRILILGGTTEARQLAQKLAGRDDVAVTLSLAGRTAQPAPQANDGPAAKAQPKDSGAP